MAGPIQKTSLTIDSATGLGTCQLAGVGAGNSLALVLSLGSGSTGAAGNAAPAVPTDTGDATGWTLAVGPVSIKGAAAATTQAAIYYKLGASAGTHSLSQTLPAASFGHWTFLEFPAASALDLTTSNSGVTQVTAGDSGTTGVTSQASEAVIVALSTEAVGGLGAAGISDPATTGYTSLSAEQVTNAHEGAQHSYKEVSSTGAQIGSWAWNSGAQDVWMGVIATFKLNRPTINTQPSDQTVNVGGSATFSVSATASAGSLTYQWQDNSGGGIFANISGATTSTLTICPAVAGHNGRQYQVVVTDSNGSATSNAANLWVIFPSRAVVPLVDLMRAEAPGFQSLLDIKGWFAPNSTVGLQVEKWVAEELDPAGATGSAVGSSAGVAAAAGVGASTAASAGASTGTGAASGVGASTAASAGSSSGAATATAVGQAAVSAAGSSAGAATAAAVGISTAASAASSSGAGAASGVSASTAASAASSSGAGVAFGVGASTTAAAGSSAGTGAATGVGVSTQAAVGSAAGIASATGVGASTSAADGSASGSATVLGVSVAGSSGVGASAGTSTVSGVGSSSAEGTASSSGAASVSGVGASSAEAAGTSSGAATASGVGASSVESIGSSTGAADAQGIGASTAEAVGSSDGTSTVDGVGSSLAAGAGVASASGSSTVLGIGTGVFDAVGLAVGSSDATAAGQSLVPFTLLEAQWLEGIARLHGLIDPLTVSATSRTDGTVAQTVADVSGSVTITTTASPLGSLSTLAHYLELLARVHGLIDPLVVTEITRSDGTLNQTLSEAGGVTTVETV